MGFLDNVFEKKAIGGEQVAGKRTISRAIAGGTAHSHWDQFSGRSRWSIDRSRNAYSKVVWVFRAVHAIASAQASLDIELETKTADGYTTKEVDKDFWKLLNRRANPHEDAYAFRYRLSSQCLLSPKGAFIEIVRDQYGQPAELYLIDPDSCEPIPDARRWVKGYKITRTDPDGPPFDILPPENVLWVKTIHDPFDPYRNVTPLESVGLSIETDWLARMFNKNYLANDGRPGMLIGINADMDPDDAEELKNLMDGGSRNVGSTHVIEAEGLNFIDLSGKPRDAQWSEVLDSAKEAILDAFGVPESLVGNASGRCLRASELVHLADGSTQRADELVGQTFSLLQPGHNGTKVVQAKAEYAQHEKVYRIKTFSGRTLETNGEHPLFAGSSAGQGQKGVWKKEMTVSGWTPMSEIKLHFDKNDAIQAGVYTEVAVPTLFSQTTHKTVAVSAAKADAEALDDVPDYIFTASEAAQKAFISALYSKYGKVSQHTGFDIYLPTQEYATKLQRLLLRIGVYANVTTKKQQHAVEILTKPNILNFLFQTELEGKAKENAEKVQQRLTTKSDFSIHSLRNDGLPSGMMWDRVLEVEEIGEDQTVALTILDSTERHYLSAFWEHNTYSNADAEIENFWNEVMKPHCKAIARSLEPLSGSEEDETSVEFNFDTVDVLQRQERRRLDRFKQDFTSGLITANDYLKEAGKPPLTGDLDWYGRLLFHPSRMVGGSDADVAKVREMPVIGQQEQPTNPFAVTSAGGGDGTVGGFNDLVQGEAAGNGGDATQTSNDQAARTLRAANGRSVSSEYANPGASSEVHERVNDLINKTINVKPEVKSVRADPNRDVRNRMQGFIEGSLESWSNRQLNIVAERLTHTKVRKGTRHWTGDDAGTKSLDVDYILSTKEWSDDIVNTLASGIKATLIREASIRSNDLTDAGVKVAKLANVDDIMAEVSEVITKSVEQQSNLVQKHIGTLDISGKSIEGIQLTLQPENFDRYSWIALLAKRLTTFAIESLNYKISANVAGVVHKTWKTSDNEMNRDEHAALNNKTIDYSDVFEVGSVKMRFPADTLGTEGDACNCWIYHEVIK